MFDVLRQNLSDLWAGLPERPDLMPRVDLPVYLIHTGARADDYFFVFDFERFVARSREGIFVRPRILLMAGRDDFDRPGFTGYFRQCFAKEFEAMRDALGAEDDYGWFNRLQNGVWAAGSIAGAMSLIVLWVAVSAGRALLPSVRLPRLLRRRSKEAQLEGEIDTLRKDVDAGLAAMKVTLHPELQLHAIAKGGPGDPEALDLSDWPLPDFVTKAMRTARGKDTPHV